MKLSYELSSTRQTLASAEQKIDVIGPEVLVRGVYGIRYLWAWLVALARAETRPGAPPYS